MKLGIFYLMIWIAITTFLGHKIGKHSFGSMVYGAIIGAVGMGILICTGE